MRAAHNGIIIIGEDHRELTRGNPRGLSLCSPTPDGRSRAMAYRKVGYLEQCWYIIRYKLRELFRRRK